MRRKSSARTRRGRFTPRAKVWLELNGHYAFGHGLSEILQAVDRAGSIKQAAVELDKSYRYVWGRIKEAEQAVTTPLVETVVGGQGVQRSFLTDAARELVAGFAALRKRVFDVVEREFSRRFT